MAGLLKSKVIAITGASSGIGRAAAFECAKNGANLLIHHLGTDSTRKDAEELQKSLRSSFNTKSVLFGADLTGEGVAEELIQRTVSTFGRLDTFVSNAGICLPSPAESVTKSFLQRHIDINFTAAYLLTQAATKQFVKQGDGGSVVVVSSNTAVTGVTGLTHYSGTKAGLLGMVNTFAVEKGKHNIRYNCVLPGPTATDMITDFVKDDADRDNMIKRIPFGRLGTPQDLAGAIVFFASDLSQFVTGQHLLVDGACSHYFM
ncbi:short-chain dehydrogenase/reductase SDR [Talaromyces proteolyticus]|uniref:Short-chain dehydrogenase/reductase SDR n=1 Tax=Talaromyces proteolyticus TaxID=1131652 RepID=A0AAD4KPK1_9EURO|nr:short-chain dehydrogenase/reductase SDR [Talaromyces proteolyticus]KAH8697522.1 short-chain dehydrogenase/reductase SDR [Talaromyces proteolyticus]